MKNTVIKRTTKTLMITLMIISVVFSSVITPVNAAGKPKTPAKVKGVKASAVSTAKIKITWTKQTKNLNGYTVYRNGKAIKHVGKNTTSFTDSKLKANTSYKYTVKAYKNVKQKQYYNAKTKKWQVKKPAKKNWKKCPSGKYKGKKTRKVTVKQYGKVSNTASAKTKKAKTFELTVESTTQNSVKLSWTKFADYYEVYRNGVYIGYTGATTTEDKGLSPNTEYSYYVVRFDTAGKEYKSNTVKATTAKVPASPGISGSGNENPDSNDTGSDNNEASDNNEGGDDSVVGGNLDGSDFEKITTCYLDTYAGKRIYLGQKFSEVSSTLSSKANGTWSFARPNEKVYLYNTNTYADFLAVYVRGTQIVAWISNSEIMGVDEGVVHDRNSDGISEHSSWRYNGAKLYMNSCVMPSPINGGKSSENNEKNYEVHLVNAVRQTVGAAPLVRSIYLEGVDFNNNDKRLTYTGKVLSDVTGGSVSVSNVRYGAQSQADACAEQGKYLAHNAKHSSVPDTTPDTYIYAAIVSQRETGKAVMRGSENAGQHGCVEDAVRGWVQSPGHRGPILASTNKYIGVGINGTYHYQWFAKEGKYQSALQPYM